MNSALGYYGAWLSNERMPYQLRSAASFLNEDEVETEVPVPLHGKVDQVFKLSSGGLVPVDTKYRRRHRVFESDIIQLSVYAVILAHKYSEPVKNYGFVRTITDGPEGQVSKHYHKVRLLSEERIVAMYHRVRRIKSGHIDPLCTCNGRYH